jgi:hypothetical protein
MGAVEGDLMEISLDDAAQLRSLLLEQPEAGITRVLALIISVVFLASILELVRRGRIREEYTTIWVGVGSALLVVSLWFDVVRFLTRAVGAWTPSSTLFFFGEMFLLVLCLQYAVRLSSLTQRLKKLTQEVALLRGELQSQREQDPSRRAS